MDKRRGWNDNEASRDERQQPIDSNWLNDPCNWDICDEHETVFLMGDHCPKCKPDNGPEVQS